SLTMLLVARQSHPEVWNAQRFRDTHAEEIAEIHSAEPLDDFRHHPMRRSGMIGVLLAGWKLQTPALETATSRRPIEPFALRIRSVGEAADMEEELLDRDRILAIGAEFRHVLHHGLRDIQFAVLNQQPRCGGEKALGARECHVERIVGGGLFDSTLHRFTK